RRPVELGHDVEPPLALVEDADRLAAQGGVDHPADVVDAHLVAGARGAPGPGGQRRRPPPLPRCPPRPPRRPPHRTRPLTAPGPVLRSSAGGCARSRRTSLSGPDISTAKLAEVPLVSSVTESMIGWVKLKRVVGNSSVKRLRNPRIICCLVRNCFHWLGCFG